MSAAATIIPYEKQSEELTGRACGAACLSMAYRSLGRPAAQTEIWPLIAKANRFGQISSTTYLMAQDALKRGFHAVAIQARHPLQTLRLAKDAGIRAILNHRVQLNSAAGHYSILVDIDDKEVVVHDPLFGAARRLTHLELMQLWLPQVPNSEIAGGVMIAIGDAGQPAQAVCEFCRTALLASVNCPRCAKAVGLEPGSVMGCIKDGCIARMWNWICCPNCDYAFTLRSGAAEGAAIEAQPPAFAIAPVEAIDIVKLFGQLDKFTSHVRSIPRAANDPAVKQRLDLLEEGKEKMKAAHAEDLARRAAVFGQLAAFEEKNKQQKEAELKKIEDRNAPSPPVDGAALREAMLRNLGLK